MKSTEETQFLVNLGSRLREARETRGWGREAASGRMPRSKDSLEDWENGGVAPTIYGLAMAADVYGVTIDWLIGREQLDATLQAQRVL